MIGIPILDCTEVLTPNYVRCAARVAREGERCTACAMTKYFPNAVQNNRVMDSRNMDL